MRAASCRRLCEVIVILEAGLHVGLVMAPRLTVDPIDRGRRESPPMNTAWAAESSGNATAMVVPEVHALVGRLCNVFEWTGPEVNNNPSDKAHNRNNRPKPTALKGKQEQK
jgi:hypothetical protein